IDLASADKRSCDSIRTKIAGIFLSMDQDRLRLPSDNFRNTPPQSPHNVRVTACFRLYLHLDSYYDKATKVNGQPHLKTQMCRCSPAFAPYMSRLFKDAGHMRDICGAYAGHIRDILAFAINLHHRRG
ncbi:MAG: hypothetical protein ACXVBX_12225, partial [Flavisolibacter sp.]